VRLSGGGAAMDPDVLPRAIRGCMRSASLALLLAALSTLLSLVGGERWRPVFAAVAALNLGLALFLLLSVLAVRKRHEGPRR
jgi:hypothetical protein